MFVCNDQCITQVLILKLPAIDQFVKRTDMEQSTAPRLDLGLGRKAEISEKRGARGPLFFRFTHFPIILIAWSNVQRFLILPSSCVKF